LEQNSYVLSAANYGEGTRILIDRRKVNEEKQKSNKDIWKDLLGKIHGQLGLKDDQLAEIRFETQDRGFFSTSVGGISAATVLDYLSEVMKDKGEGPTGPAWKGIRRY